MRIDYKVFPAEDPLTGQAGRTWTLIINVAIMYNLARSWPFEAVVDSGSPFCYFHSLIGEVLGLRTTKGPRGELGGVVGGSAGEAFYHRIKLLVAGSTIEIVAGFCPTLAFSAILGRHGFFENFRLAADVT